MATSIGVKLKMDGEAEFRKNLNNIVSSTKNLDKQLDVLEKSFKDEAKSMEQNEKQTELLERKKQALQKQVEEMNQALEYAKEHYSENSAEVTSWEAALAQAESQLEATNQQLQECADYQGEATSALDELNSTIADQESQLDDLRDAYVDAVLQFGEGSDEANALAGEISNLSGELQGNKAKLEEAQDALKGVEDAASGASGELDTIQNEMDETGSGAEELVGKFGSSFMGAASAIESAGVAGIIGIIAEELIELGKQAVEMMDEVQEASNEMIRATLLTGDGLVDVENAAYDAYLQIDDTNTSLANMEAIGGTLYTRLGLTGDALEEAILLFGQYSAATGVDGVNAVNDLVDVMRRWGLETEDDATNIETLTGLMDSFVYGSAQGKLTVDDITSAVREQSGAWSDVGYSVDEAIALMAAFTDAGGDTSTLTAALTKSINALDDKTDDMGQAWQDAIDIMVNAKDRSSALSQTIGDTGVTIEQAFGKQAAGKMIDVFKDGKVQSDVYNQALKDVDGTMVGLYEATKTVSDGLDTVTKAFGSWEYQMYQNDQAIKQQYKDWQNSSSEAADSMISDYNNIYSELSTPIPMHVTAPAIGYSQSGTTYTPYSGGRYTFARAYDQAMILSAPTIFGAMGNNLLVGGDRPGNEIVVGESHLLDMMSKVMNRSGGIVVNVYGAEGQSENAIADFVIDKLQRELINSEVF